MPVFSAGELIGLLVFVLVVVGIAFSLLRLNAAMEAPASVGERSDGGGETSQSEDHAAPRPQSAHVPSTPRGKRVRRR